MKKGSFVLPLQSETTKGSIMGLLKSQLGTAQPHKTLHWTHGISVLYGSIYKSGGNHPECTSHLLKTSSQAESGFETLALLLPESTKYARETLFEPAKTRVIKMHMEVLSRPKRESISWE